MKHLIDPMDLSKQETDQIIALAQDSAALRVNHVFGNGINRRHTFHVNTLDLISRVFWSGIEGHSQAQASVQSFAA